MNLPLSSSNAKVCFLIVVFPPPRLSSRSSCLRSLMPCLRGRWNLRSMWLTKVMMEITSMSLSGKQLCLWNVEDVSLQLLRNGREYLLQESFGRKIICLVYFCAYQHKHSLKPVIWYVFSRPGYIFFWGKRRGESSSVVRGRGRRLFSGRRI